MDVRTATSVDQGYERLEKRRIAVCSPVPVSDLASPKVFRLERKHAPGESQQEIAGGITSLPTSTETPKRTFAAPFDCAVTRFTSEGGVPDLATVLVRENAIYCILLKKRVYYERSHRFADESSPLSYVSQSNWRSEPTCIRRAIVFLWSCPLSRLWISYLLAQFSCCASRSKQVAEKRAGKDR